MNPEPAAWSSLERDGVRLACLDYGGAGQPALLLHGLAGHAGDWSETASWLTRVRRVLALDARGHGRSEREPADVSDAAHVADVAFAIEQFGLGPVALVGQSFGGRTAMLVAARHPALVRALVVADASPAAGDANGAATVEASLARWPAPFGSREAAVAYFGGPSLAAEAWADGLEHRDGGWWPRFEPSVMGRTLCEGIGRDSWHDWERVRCPTLVVRAGAGIVPSADARAMADRLPQARLVELPGAAHDLHLDRPEEWRAVLSDFLAELP